MQLLKEVGGLTHGARETCQTFRQVSVVLVFGLGHVLCMRVAVHFLGDRKQVTAPALDGALVHVILARQLRIRPSISRRSLLDQQAAQFLHGTSKVGVIPMMSQG